MDSRAHEDRPMLPPDGTFLAALQPDDIDGSPRPGEKEMLLAALRFYFGPAQWWNTVEKDEKADLDKLYDILRQDGERYDILEKETTLGRGYFDREHQTPGEVKLYAATNTRGNRDNPGYFLYEAKNNLTFYVGPGLVSFEGRELPRHVFNTLVLEHKGDRKHRPSQSHTLDFGFLDDEEPEPEPSDLDFFPDLAALAALRPEDIDGPAREDEKEMLLKALQFYFGPAEKLKAVAKDEPDLNGLNALLQKRYKLLEAQTALGPGYFGQEHQPQEQVKLYVATDKRKDNPDRLPSYILYEAKNNLMFYVGPDFFHEKPARKVINTVKLNPRHLAQESHTLDFAMSLLR